MSKKRVGFLLVLASLPVAFVAHRAVSLYNDAIEAEAEIVRAWRDSQVAYDDLWKSVSESTQVTDAYEDDFRAVLHGSLSAQDSRGLHAVTAWLRTLDPGLDPRMYGKLQSMVEDGRDRYQVSQRDVSELQAQYSVSLQRFPDFLLARSMGLPRPTQGAWTPEQDIDGDGVLTVLDFPVVTSTRTRTVYADGVDDRLLSGAP